MYEILEEGFRSAVKYGILVLEAIGAIIILVSAIRALVGLLKGPARARLTLAEGIATGLNFLLGGEVLNTIVAPNWDGIGKTCAIMLIRAAMAVLLHWENKHENEKEILPEADVLARQASQPKH